MREKKRVLDILVNLDYIIAGSSLAVLVFVTFFGVIMRYFVNKPFVWQEEVQLWCFVWVVFFGSGAAVRAGSHVAIEVLVDILPSFLRKIIEVLIYIIVILALLYFMRQGMNLVQQMVKTGRSTNILKVPYKIIYGAFPVGCILMIINYVAVIYKKYFMKKFEGNGGEVNGN